jgi:hypothetical protein
MDQNFSSKLLQVFFYTEVSTVAILSRMSCSEKIFKVKSTLVDIVFTRKRQLLWSYIFLAQTINNQYKATYRASAALGDAVQPTRGSTKQILGKSMN